MSQLEYANHSNQRMLEKPNKTLTTTITKASSIAAKVKLVFNKLLYRVESNKNSKACSQNPNMLSLNLLISNRL